eukprot:9229063-Pyramimonas_sp.AAC.1
MAPDGMRGAWRDHLGARRYLTQLGDAGRVEAPRRWPMKEGASLSPQEMQNMRTLARGDLEYKSVCWATRQLDFTTSERLLPGRSAGNIAD